MLMAVVNVMVALAEKLGSALLRACTVTDPPAGRVSGAVNNALSGSVCEFGTNPTAVFPPTIPLTSHVTVASRAPVTVAWKDCAAPSATVAEEGEINTPINAPMETEMEAALDGSACGVATI